LPPAQARRRQREREDNLVLRLKAFGFGKEVLKRLNREYKTLRFAADEVGQTVASYNDWMPNR
jgi:hypothetical protein